jgi:plastocyanin
MFGTCRPKRLRPQRGAARGLGLVGVALTLAILPSAQAAEAGVTINNRMFMPSEVTVSVGDTVTWTNASNEDHNVRGGPFNSPVLKPGEHFSHTFTKSGAVRYNCDIHPTMRGTVTVK